MLIDAELPKFLWVEAVKLAVYLRNRTTTKGTVGSTPYECATGAKPNLAQLPSFGQEVLVLIEALSKLNAKLKLARWVGFDEQSKAHRVYWPEKRSVSVERNLVFVPEAPVEAAIVPEGENSPNSSQNSPLTPNSVASTPPKPSEIDSMTTQMLSEAPGTQSSSKAKPEEPSTSIHPPTDQGELSQHIEGLPGPRKRNPSPWIKALQEGRGTAGGRGAQKVLKSMLSPETAKLAVKGTEDVPIFALAAMVGDEPSFKEAMEGPDREKWIEAAREEISTIRAMGTYTPTRKPRDANTISCVWALKVKHGPTNKIVKHKARLCALGNRQKFGIDYSETASPTARIFSIRFILALAAMHDWEVHQINFKNVYLNGDLDEDIYMT